MRENCHFDAETVKQAMEGVSYVLHQAALPSVPHSIADPLTTHQVNVTEMLKVLLAAREVGVKRLVYASSSLVYGDSPELPSGSRKQAFFTPTAWFRYAPARKACASATQPALAKLPKRESYLILIPMLDGRRPVIYGDRMQSRDFTYVENVVECNLLACRAKGAAGDVPQC